MEGGCAHVAGHLLVLVTLLGPLLVPLHVPTQLRSESKTSFTEITHILPRVLLAHVRPPRLCVEVRLFALVTAILCSRMLSQEMVGEFTTVGTCLWAVVTDVILWVRGQKGRIYFFISGQDIFCFL